MKLNTYLKNNKITSLSTIKKFLTDKIVIVTGNSNNHSYGPIGTKIKVVASSSIGTASATYLDGKGNTINYSDLDISIDINEEIKLLVEQKEEIDKQISELKDKQKIMKELKMDVWDEDTHKVYKTLQVLKTKKSDIEKSKIISDLIKK